MTEVKDSVHNYLNPQNIKRPAIAKDQERLLSMPEALSDRQTVSYTAGKKEKKKQNKNLQRTK